MTKRSATKPQPWKARWGNNYGVKHDMSRTPEYKAWKGLRRRCDPVRAEIYPDYAGRGISVCERWIVSFESFFEDMGPRPTREHSLDRIDVNGNYEPGNCRWATRKEQANNRRVSLLFTWNGETMCLDDWAVRLGVKSRAFWSRYYAGWDLDKILSTPVRRWRHRQSSSPST